MLAAVPRTPPYVRDQLDGHGWDRLFGKLVRLDTAADERFGVPGEIDSYPQRFGPAARHPVLQIRELREGKVATHNARVGEEIGAR